MTIYDPANHESSTHVEITVNTGVRYLIEGEYTIAS